MLKSNINVAVVEDNGLARTNIRNHLLDMGFTDIGCFSSGRELRASLKKRTLDLLLIDYHLGQNKNGVEVIQELKSDGLLKHSTCIMFITSDRLPLIIGQIADIHPEAVVIKPYTILNLSKTINNCINLHQFLLPVYYMMDEQNYQQALVVIDLLLKENDKPRKQISLCKLRARMLTQLERYHEAAEVYRTILEGSDKILWAKWGLVQNLFLDNKIEESQLLLHELTGSQLTSDKACEWLARICINNNQYSRAEAYMEKIREGELSISATRLKAYIYQAQERSQEAISLLEKKRESNRSIRERFDEITLDLARCYLIEAEEKQLNERDTDLQVAKFLIASAGRKTSDPHLSIKKYYMHAAVAHLEGNINRVHEILARPGMDELQSADISTIYDAISTNKKLGYIDRAKQLLELSQYKLQDIEEGNEKTISSMLVLRGEEFIGEHKPMALKFNQRGVEKYATQQYTGAIEEFHKAYLLFPREVAFSLNLLQGLVEAEIIQFKNIITLDFLYELQNRNLNAANKKRLAQIVRRINRKGVVFNPVSLTELSAQTTNITKK